MQWADSFFYLFSSFIFFFLTPNMVFGEWRCIVFSSFLFLGIPGDKGKVYKGSTIGF